MNVIIQQLENAKLFLQYTIGALQIVNDLSEEPKTKSFTKNQEQECRESVEAIDGLIILEKNKIPKP